MTILVKLKLFKTDFKGLKIFLPRKYMILFYNVKIKFMVRKILKLRIKINHNKKIAILTYLTL